MDRLLASVQFLKGVGPKRSKQLSRLGIETVFDLLWLVPRSYFNRGNLTKISDLQTADKVNIRAEVQAVQTSHTRRGMQIFKALLNDGSGLVMAVWFNQPFLKNIIIPRKELFVSGRVNSSYGKMEINVSEYEIMDKSSLDCKILPVYPLTEGLNQNLLRSLILNTLQDYLPFYPEIINEDLRKQYELYDIYTAFKNIHFPSGREGYLQARKRLALEELLLFQISLCQEEKEILPQENNFKVHQEKNDLVKRIINNLPFKLTNGQQRVVNEIFYDMQSKSNMNRLLQGDVGSGKTVVAALAMAKAVASGFQAAIMAPTEILAEQHFNSINNLFKETEIVTARLTGGISAAERRMILEAAERGEIDILVGTHALIQQDVKFSDLGLVVIDEQHRFGVRQRAMLAEKGTMPDILVMTATPIPRTLALTVYGRLDLSVIDELPPGRKPVITRYIKQSARKQAYNFIRKEIKKQKQVYVVCPLVEESEKQDLQAAVSLYEELRDIFPDINVGLLHGRMRPAEKDYIMNSFKKGIIQILVSTTVIEVGVDVPNASIMIIEHAERFGLSQLHQLRGRVGRGQEQSYCFLIGNPHTEEALKRLQVMESTSDGFKLAQADLLIRGPGDFWGVRQHGLHQLRVADLTRDHKIIELSRRLVPGFNQIENLQNYVKLKFKKSDDIAPN